MDNQTLCKEIMNLIDIEIGRSSYAMDVLIDLQQSYQPSNDEEMDELIHSFDKGIQEHVTFPEEMQLLKKKLQSFFDDLEKQKMND